MLFTKPTNLSIEADIHKNTKRKPKRDPTENDGQDLTGSVALENTTQYRLAENHT